MKDKIIEKSIELLSKNGLKFSVDDLASSLSISKKTIYKYFSSKEELAMAVYTDIFSKARKAFDKYITDKKVTDLYSALFTYMNVVFFCREELFNRFSLNDSMAEYANQTKKHLYSALEEYLSLIGLGNLTSNKAFPIMLDASLEQISIREDKEDLLGDLISILLKK